MKRLALGLVVLGLLLAGTIAYMRRGDILLALVARQAAAEKVLPHQEIAWAQGPAAAPEGPRPPNIIFILADDLGTNDISTFGGGLIPTPAIDRLAAEGALFANAYSGTATCAPSRAMLMTGRYPTRTGFEFTPTPEGMGRAVIAIASSSDSGLPPADYDEAAAKAAPPYPQQGLPGAEVTTAEMLKAVNYHTVHIGKWHTGLGPEFGPNGQGFDESLLMASGLHLPADHPDVVNARLSFDPIDKFLWARMRHAASLNGGPWFEPGGYLTDYWTDEAIKVIRANRNRPFFLNLAHWTVHSPLQATREDYEAVGPIEPERARVYAAMIRALDRSVARILETLEAEGLADNTLVVFTSDNGAPGYIGLDDVNAPYRGWKLTLFEGGIRTPIFMRWPGRIPAGVRVDAPVAHIDVAPTLAAAAGAALPEGVTIDGVDLLPYATGAAPAGARPHEALFWSSGHYKAVRAGDWKLQVSDKPAKTWLFDLAADPTEQTNLAEARPEIVAELKARLEAHHAGARPPLYAATIQAPVAVDKTLAERAGPQDELIYWPN